MNPTRPRLLAQLREEPIVELHRARRDEYITEGCIRSLTENMSTDWRYWVEQPMSDDKAMGRRVQHTPDGPPTVNSDDAGLEVETFEPEPDPLYLNPHLPKPQIA